MEIFQAATSEEDYDTVLEERLGKILALKPQSSDSQKLSPSVHGSLPEHAPAPPTKLIGPYTATHHAAGSFSTVYRACSPSDSSRLLALKVMTPSQSAPPHSPNREVRILDHAAHSSIISLLSSFTPTPSGRHFISFLNMLPEWPKRSQSSCSTRPRLPLHAPLPCHIPFLAAFLSQQTCDCNPRYPHPLPSTHSLLRPRTHPLHRHYPP